MSEISAVNEQFLRRREVIQATGLGTSSMYERIAAGTFPKPVKLNPDSQRSPVAWLGSEIRQWQALRIAERAATDARIKKCGA